MFRERVWAELQSQGDIQQLAPSSPNRAPVFALWCILPRDVRTLTFCQLMVFRIKPLKVSHF